MYNGGHGDPTFAAGSKPRKRYPVTATDVPRTDCNYVICSTISCIFYVMFNNSVRPHLCALQSLSVPPVTTTHSVLVLD